jgi:type II secretory pathway pseudopilin PulG
MGPFIGMLAGAALAGLFQFCNRSEEKTLEECERAARDVLRRQRELDGNVLLVSDGHRRQEPRRGAELESGS